MGDTPAVTIIVCTSNRADNLRQTLAAIAQVCVPEQMPTELLVVDNASTDHTAEVVAACQLPNMPVRTVHEAQRGKGYAYNRGMAEAKGEVFLFTDDDVRPPQNWIEGICGPILRGEADAVAGGVKIAQHLERAWMEGTHRIWLADTEGIDPEQPDRIVGANMAFSRHLLEKVPEFDTELGPGALGFFDETLFSWQISKAGYRTTTAFDVCVEHHFDAARLTTDSFIQSATKMGRSYAYLAYHWKHDHEVHVYSQLMYCYFRHLLSRARRHRKYRKIGMWPGYELSMLSHIFYLRQYMIESKTPRKYDKYGLRKLRHE